METTLRLKNPAALESRKSRRPDLPRVLLACLLGALIAALAVGKIARPSLPKPELLPPDPARLHLAPTLSAGERARAARGVRSRALAPDTAAEQGNPKFLACRLELESRRIRFRDRSPFPACTRAFSRAPGCGSLKREFLEALYLYAYALATESPDSALLLLGEAVPLLAGCDSALPLHQRALELDRQLRRRALTKQRQRVQGTSHGRPPGAR